MFFVYTKECILKKSINVKKETVRYELNELQAVTVINFVVFSSGLISRLIGRDTMSVLKVFLMFTVFEAVIKNNNNSVLRLQTWQVSVERSRERDLYGKKLCDWSDLFQICFLLWQHGDATRLYVLVFLT